jgi:hypothetical protein
MQLPKTYKLQVDVTQSQEKIQLQKKSIDNSINKISNYIINMGDAFLLWSSPLGSCLTLFPGRRLFMEIWVTFKSGPWLVDLGHKEWVLEGDI